MVYHSAFNESCDEVYCGCALLPLRTRTRGPAPFSNVAAVDIIDETLNYFKANILFRSFDVKGAADRVLVYLTFYTLLCLKSIIKSTKEQAVRTLSVLATQQFSMPGEADFVLADFFAKPADLNEADMWRSYVRQLREELGLRLIDKVYRSEDGHGSSLPSTYWMMFAKRKFLGKAIEK
jgi:actin related protein 2/3 complex subunit 3